MARYIEESEVKRMIIRRGWMSEEELENSSVVADLPSAQQNRIARETAGKSPEEIYDFLHWLLIDYGRQFTDSRLAVIEWLKEENNG